jgi:Cys-tRNA synthase (O-phospho-L-seryl-tRNA:Cys-tRNA synthase)
MSKQSYYFSHDSNARNDVKIIKLRREMGLEGYGIYWCIIETLRDTSEYKLPVNAIDDIAFGLVVDAEKVRSVIVDYDLFIVLNDEFYSDRLLRNMESYKSTSKRLSEAGKSAMAKRYEKKEPSKIKFVQ